jgi:hypothetical protein
MGEEDLHAVNVALRRGERTGNRQQKLIAAVDRIRRDRRCLMPTSCALLGGALPDESRRSRP